VIFRVGVAPPCVVLDLEGTLGKMFLFVYINLPGYYGCELLPMADVVQCMSRAPMAASSSRDVDSSTEQVRTIANEQSIQELLDVLDDADCRAILDATTDTALSANEVSEACELPLSTTYRKLDLLTSTGLIEERTRIRRSGKHPREYARSVRNVVVSISAHGEIELQVAHCENPERVDSPTSATRE
jgi:predicted transcriptional regulator